MNNEYFDVNLLEINENNICNDSNIFNLKIEDLNYDTDFEQESNDYIRILYTWYYKINFNYFNLNDLNVYISKNNIFKNKLNNLINVRKNQNYFFTGDIIKLKNKCFKLGEDVFIYLIIYYDNVKINIEFYGRLLVGGVVGA